MFKLCYYELTIVLLYFCYQWHTALFLFLDSQCTLKASCGHNVKYLI